MRCRVGPVLSGPGELTTQERAWVTRCIALTKAIQD